MVRNQIPGASGEDGTYVGEEAMLPGTLEVVTDLAFERSAHGEAATEWWETGCPGSRSRTR
jgi:hypothetical protein